MGVFQNNLMGAAAAAASAGGNFYTHQIDNSVRIPAPSGTSSSNGRLTRTFSTVDSNVHFTLNFWIKRSAIEGSNPVGAARLLNVFTPRSGTSGSVLQEFGFSATGSYGAGDAFVITNTNTGAYILSTNNLFRDTSAWYNIHIQADLDNGTAGEKLKIFVNGTEASYNVDNRSSYTSLAGVVAGAWTIGDYYGYGYPIQSYLAQWCYIDGTTYAASEFGETKNGVWIPKDPSGLTFGNAGHLLNFESSSDLGNDSSGNNNDWSTSNIDSHDQMLDSPTFNSSSNGGNFATLGGLEKNSGGFTISEGNLKYAIGTNQRGFIASQGVPDSGKYYWEVRVTAFGGSQDDVYIGVCEPDKSRSNLTGSRGGATVSGAGNYTVNLYNGAMVLDGSFQSNDAIGNKRAVPQTVGIAIDRDNNTFKWTYDGSTYSSTYAIPSSGVLAPFLGSGGGSSTASGVFNFGADSTFAGLVSAGGNADGNGYGDFSLAVPSGYVALCAANLPTADAVDPAQTDDDYPQKLFGTLQYTGNGSERTIDTSFQIDKSWARSTVQGQDWYVLDTSRGYFGTSSNNYYIKLNAEGGQASLPQYNFKAQSGSDITITGGSWMNSSGHTQQMWNWRLAGGTTSTNTQGGVNSTVQVDPSGCFSIVTYQAGLSSSGAVTVGHGLSKAPTFLIQTAYGSGVTGQRWVRSSGLTSWNYGIQITSNGAQQDKSGNGDMSATPTSSVFSVNYTEGLGDGSSDNITYAFADCEGYIKSGKFIGNADADGTFIYLGFKPAFFWILHAASGDDPQVWDTSNGSYNPMTKTLSTHNNSAQVDNVNRSVDFLSNGVKIRSSNSNVNSSNAAGIIYLAMAKNPFQYATAR